MDSPNVPERLIRHHLGNGPLRIRPIPTGKFNSSYFVRLGDDEYVLRIAPPPDTGFVFYERDMMRQEPGLHRIVRERTSVPVADIVVYDDSLFGAIRRSNSRCWTTAAFPSPLSGKATGAPAMTRLPRKSGGCSTSSTKFRSTL